MVATGSVKVGEMHKSDSNKEEKQDVLVAASPTLRLNPTAPRSACNQLSSLILDLIPRKQSCALPGITFL